MAKISQGNEIIIELAYYYKNGYLKDYLAQMTDQELSYIQLSMLVEPKLIPDYKDIVEIVAKEFRKRTLSQYLDNNTSEFLAEHYSDFAEDISIKQFQKSYRYCQERDIDYPHLVKWCPAMMDIDLVHRIYECLTTYGLNKNQVFKILTSDSSNLVYFEQLLEKFKITNPRELENDDDFKQFVIYTAQTLEKSKSGTESYKKLVDQEIRQNEGILRKLQ